jgi:hypothetical protein
VFVGVSRLSVKRPTYGHLRNVRKSWAEDAKLRIPMKPAGYSDLKAATHSDLKPATIPI